MIQKHKELQKIKKNTVPVKVQCFVFARSIKNKWKTKTKTNQVPSMQMSRAVPICQKAWQKYLLPKQCMRMESGNLSFEAYRFPHNGALQDASPNYKIPQMQQLLKQCLQVS